MRRRYGVLFSVLVAAAAAGIACGGDEDDGVFDGEKDGSAGSSGGSAGASMGGTGGSAGSGPGGSSQGGSAQGGSGPGGAGGIGAAAGAGGVDSGAPCAPPGDTSKAALCLTFDPEVMTLDSSVDIDGQGILVVEIFDVQDPEPDTGPAVPAIATEIFPQQPGGDAGALETSINTLPALRFEGLPATVYVRGIFVDNFLAFASDSLLWGTWLAGVDLSNGLDDMTALSPVPLTIGQGTNVRLPMTALRRLEVSMTASATPLDDGEGPVGWAAFDTQTPGAGDGIWGVGEARCLGVATGPARVKGFVIGPGPHYIFAQLDDYDFGSDDPPGALLSVDSSGPTPQIPAANLVTFGATDFFAYLNIDLNAVRPLDPDAGAPAGFSCSQISDAGTD